MLSNVGLKDWIAHSQDEYVGDAVKAAADLNSLAQWRRTSRTDVGTRH